MARMSISMPDQLKVEMDAIGSVNWSALAVEAFQRVVRKSRKVDAMNTEQVVERLRASYEETKSADQEEGHTTGVSWASETAEAAELMWLDQDGSADALHVWRVSDSPFEDYDNSEFWEIAGGLESRPPLAYIEGFVEGAVEVWEKVKDQVRD